MLWASFSKFFSLVTATARESALWTGPSGAGAIFRFPAMVLSNELSELAGGAVDFSARGGSHRPGHAAREKLSRAARRIQFAAFHDDAPAAHDDLRPALVDMPLVRRVADRIVHHRIVDALLDFGIPDGDVGVRTDRDRALARVQAVHARMVGRAERDELVDAEPSLQHAFGKENRQAHLD